MRLWTKDNVGLFSVLANERYFKVLVCHRFVSEAIHHTPVGDNREQSSPIHNQPEKARHHHQLKAYDRAAVSALALTQNS